MVLLLAWSADEAGGTRETSDRVLVESAQRGSADAFAMLHARYYSRIYRLAYLKTDNVSDAEDVASETFLRALASLPRFRFNPTPNGAGYSFYPWLHRIALNLIVDSHRGRPAAGVVSLDAPVIEGMRELLADRLPQSDASRNPQEIAERNEVQQLVRASIASLPADQSDVLVYRFLGDLSLKEIAPLMNRSESAVKSLLHRAVVALRADLETQLDAVERGDVAARSQERVSQEVLQHVGGSPLRSHRRSDR